MLTVHVTPHRLRRTRHTVAEILAQPHVIHDGKAAHARSLDAGGIGCAPDPEGHVQSIDHRYASIATRA